jgi:hypothetical protein
MDSTRRCSRSARIGVLVGAAAMLAACGSSAPDPGGEALPAPLTSSFLLDVAADTPFGQVVAAEQQGIAVERSGGFQTTDLVAPASTATIFDLNAGAALDDAVIDARAAELAAIFGVSGAVERLDADRQVGDGDGRLLVVNAPRGGDGGSFWFEGGSDLRGGMLPCPTLPDGFCDGEVAISEPPASTERAEQQIADAMTVLGIEPNAYVVERFDQATSIEFSVVFAPNGWRSGVTWGFSVGSSGEVAAAYGAFTAPQEAVGVALVDIDTAIDRLHAGYAGFGGIAPPTTRLADTSEPASTPVAPAEASTTTTTTTIPGSALPPPPVDGDLVDTTTAATTTSLGQPRVTSPPTTLPGTPPMGSRAEPPVDGTESPWLRIDRVELGLQTFWESPSGPWLVPTFVFVADDGSEYGVVAVDASAMVLIEPSTTLPPPTTMVEGYVPTPEPMPTLLADDGTPLTIPVPPYDGTGSTDYYNSLFADVLVGRDLASVVNTLEGSGWTVRILDEDLDQNVDADLRWDRANVLHRNEIVTGVYADPWVPGAADSTTTGTSVSSTTTSTTTTTSEPPDAPPTTTISPAEGSLDEWLDADGRAELLRSFESLWIGQPVDSARGALESIGYIVRVVEPDGAMTADLVPYRVNFGVSGGVIEWVSLG